MPNTAEPARALTDAQIEQFIRDGYVKIERAFARELADQGRDVLWRDSGCDPDDPKTWTKPVIRKDRWQPRMSLGTFPVRFPSPDDPGDAGWHIDVSFGTDNPDFMEWRANITSKNRALLMLFLFSDVGEEDAPTRIRAGSHLDIARMLAPAGENGLTLRELAANGFAETAELPEVLATGDAGTVYLCHPFLVHAAQPHRGTRPRFLAQPPLSPAAPLSLNRQNGDYSPVERAIRNALSN